MREAPKIEIHIVQSAEEVEGIGEVGVPPIASAVVNAVFNAAGIRIRHLPMKPEAVKELLKRTSLR